MSGKPLPEPHPEPTPSKLHLLCQTWGGEGWRGEQQKKGTHRKLSGEVAHRLLSRDFSVFFHWEQLFPVVVPEVETIVCRESPSASTCTFSVMEEPHCKRVPVVVLPNQTAQAFLHRGNFNRYTKRPLQDSAIIFSTPGMGESAFFCSNHRVSCKCSNPQDGKSTDFSAGKCHLLYFVVVPESLITLHQQKFEDVEAVF